MKLKNRYIATLSILTLLSSCGVYTKFESPTIDDTTLAGEDIELREESLVELPSWSDYFTDPLLQSLIERALEANSDLRIAELNISQAERNVRTVRLAMLPTATISAQASVSTVSPLSYSIPLSASWEIDVFGRKRNTTRQADAVVKQTKEYEALIRTQIIEAVALNYYALILADQQADITRESLTLMGESVRTIEALMEVGAQNRAAVEQARASYNAIELSLESLEQSRVLSSNNLNLLLNRTPIYIERSGVITPATIDLEPSISLIALSSRPDVRYAEAQLCQSFYGVNYARASLYPSIAISGSVTYSAGDIIAAALGSITQPLFMAGTNLANLANAKDIYEQQLLAFEKSLLTAGKEVNDAIITAQTAKRKSVIASSQVESLQGAVETTQALMDSGAATYIEVIAAQSSYLSARVDQATISYNEAVAQISLYKALGGMRY